MRYRPEIDGLRAVAVVPVILFHAGFEAFGGGFVGVDIFFVISGYLITSILIKEMEAERFSLVDFYDRRARRILPALFLVSLVSAVFAWLLLLKHDFNDFFRSLVAVATFSSNIYFWLESDYFSTAAELKPMLHTWSLAVEEQYYILFPLILMAMWRYGRFVLLTLLAIIFLLSFGYAQMIVDDRPMEAFFLLPTRAWEILVGAFCAFYLHSGRPTGSAMARQLFSGLGLGLIVMAVLAYSPDTPSPSIYMLAPTMGAAFVILFATEGTFARRLLSASPMVGIGLVSYSAYLWHQPIFSFVRHNSLEEPGAAVMILLSACAVFLAWLTWKFVETPFRRKSVSRRHIFIGSASGSVLILAAGLAVHFNGAVNYGNGRFNLLDQEITLLDYESNNKALQKASWSVLREYADELEYVADRNDSNNDRKWFLPDDGRFNVLLVGNSHSKDLFNIMFLNPETSNHIRIGRYNAQIGELKPDHPFFESYSYKHADVVMVATRFDDRRGDVSNLQPLAERVLRDEKSIVLVKNIFEFPTLLGGKWTLFDMAVHQAIEAGIQDGDYISRMANEYYYEAFTAGDVDSRVIAANEEIHRLEGVDPRIIVLDRMDYICSRVERTCYSGSNQLEKYFPDYGHHTIAGATFFSSRVDEVDWLRPVLDLAQQIKS